MSTKILVDNAKIMPKGQVTIPADFRDILGVSNGDRIVFVFDTKSVRIVNSAVFAMQALQSEMAGEAIRAGLTSGENVQNLVAELRNEDER